MDTIIDSKESPLIHTIIFHRTASDICDGAGRLNQTILIRPVNKFVLLVTIFCASLIIASDLPNLSEIVGGGALILILGWWWGPFRGFRSVGNPRLLADSLVPVQVQFSPVGIYVSEKTYVSSYPWRKISSAEIDRRGLYILVRSLRQYSEVFIPRRAFSDWREMLTVHKKCLDYMSIELAGNMALPQPEKAIARITTHRNLRTAPTRIATIILWILLLIAPTLLYYQFSLSVAKSQIQNALSGIVPHLITNFERQTEKGGSNGAGRLGHVTQTPVHEISHE